MTVAIDHALNGRDRGTYDDCVRRGREAARSQWVLGDLALLVETAYGESTLERFADDIGVEYNTLRQYRQVSAAYRNDERSSNVPWTVHQILASQPTATPCSTADPRHARSASLARQAPACRPGPPARPAS